MHNSLLSGKRRVEVPDAYNGMRSGEKLSGVYALVDPRQADVVRYVGSSTNCYKRLIDHAAGYIPRNADGPKRVWLCELKKAGLKPVMVYLEEVVAAKASATMHAVERRWIERFRAKDQADLNATLLAGERKYLRDQIKKLEIENAKLRALLLQHATQRATLHQTLRCEDPKTATQRNVSL